MIPTEGEVNAENPPPGLGQDLTPVEVIGERGSSRQKDIVIALVGPTGVGKSAVSLLIAPFLQAEIVSIDSAQVFQKLDIGTSKPSPVQRKQVPHHLIDAFPPDKELTVADFQQFAEEAIEEISGRGKVPLLVGGSGLYYRAVVDKLSFSGIVEDQGLRESLAEVARESSPLELHAFLEEVDPEAAREIHSHNTRRVIRALEVWLKGGKISRREESWEEYSSPYQLISLGLERERSSLYQVTDDRVDNMIDQGLVEEVDTLRSQGLGHWPNTSQIIGYRQILDHLEGKCSLEEAVEETKKLTRHLVKRQYTWFKKDKRIKWFEVPTESAYDIDLLSKDLENIARDMLEYVHHRLKGLD